MYMYYVSVLCICWKGPVQAAVGNNRCKTWAIILVALKNRTSRISRSTSFEIRSDSLGALKAIAKRSSKATLLNKIISEITLIEAEKEVKKKTTLDHIPGLSNEWPDSLSRLSAPEAKTIPDRLGSVERTLCTPRDSSIWITAGDPPVRRHSRKIRGPNGYAIATVG